MTFNITKAYRRINIIKDFGFPVYYPILSDSCKDIFYNIYDDRDYFTIYIENPYDRLENEELYEDEGEKNIIYIY